jgi:hypothetical protein
MRRGVACYPVYCALCSTACLALCLAVCYAVCCAVCCNFSHLKVFFPHTSCVHSFLIVENDLHREQSEGGRASDSGVSQDESAELLTIQSERGSSLLAK